MRQLSGQKSIGVLVVLTVGCVTLLAPGALASGRQTAKQAWPGGVAVIGYRSPQALDRALARFPARVVRRLPALGVAQVRPAGSPARFAASIGRLPGIAYVQRPIPRESMLEPALAPALRPGGMYEWQFAATRETEVPDAVLRAASSVTIAVVDTGADLSAPDLAAKAPATHSLISGGSDVTDTHGHGTFVASLAAGSVTNAEGVAGFGGDAKLLVVQAGHPDGSFTDLDEANAIVYAVDHGAKIINLSLGGMQTTLTEQSAVDYAVQHGVLLVAAAGNQALEGNPVEYPAALLQPFGSNGQGGRGLAVGASTLSGTRAAFSNTGSYISLAAPGEDVFGAISATASPGLWSPVALPGSSAGVYGYSSGTSFAAPEVAGAAALVWGSNPQLSLGEVVSVLKATASGRGYWNEELGFGVIDAASAVARAQGIDATAPKVQLTGTTNGLRVTLRWSSPSASTYRLSVSKDGGPGRMLLASTADTSAGYDLDLGHTYAFTVTAVDPYGYAAQSAPFQVSLGQAAAKLTLRASRTRGRQPLNVRFHAVLKPQGSSLAVGTRLVLFESFDGTSWRPFARAKTGSTGEASVRVLLRRAVYRVRARFAGAPDLAATTSSALTVRVR